MSYPPNTMQYERIQRRIAFVGLTVVLFCTGCGPSTRAPRIVDKAEWRPAMRDLLARYPKISESITAYEHDAFIDYKYAWKIVGQGEEIEQLIVDLNLQPTTTDHAKFKELEQSIPDTWNLPRSAEIGVYASEGYGVEHQEGTDLLLLVRDPAVNETIALYEWIF